MKSRVPLLLLIAVLALFFTGIGWLIRTRVAGGDVFPAYSSLRADPLGTRALFEALQLDPSLAVQRWLRPIHRLDTGAGSTLVLPGLTRDTWNELTRQDAAALDSAARRGAKIVLLFAAEIEPSDAEDPTARSLSNREEKPRTPAQKAEETRKQELPDRLKPAVWSDLWQLRVQRRYVLDNGVGAIRRAAGLEQLPSSLPWKSDLSFATNPPWRTVYSRGGYPVMVDRKLGLGSIVVAADAFVASNEALQKNRQTELLAWLLGSSKNIVFVESHLGVGEDIGIATLARRYGLAGALGMLVVWAVLFAWRRAALFVPPPAEQTERILTYHQTAGLEALLRRSVPATQLMSTCLAEWKTTASPADVARVETALAGSAAVEAPTVAYNTAAAALKRKPHL